MSAEEVDSGFGTPARWRRLREVLEEALEREGDARSSFVREASAGDAEPRARGAPAARGRGAPGAGAGAARAEPGSAPELAASDFSVSGPGRASRPTARAQPRSRPEPPLRNLVNEKLDRFLSRTRPKTPVLAVDLERVEANLGALQAAFPEARIYYAVKANPAPETLRRLVPLGCRSDVASLAEVRAALAAGADPGRISFGNTIKKEHDIGEAFRAGVRLFVASSRSTSRACRARRTSPSS